MKNLISMTDYVLTYGETYLQMIRYAKFLKLPLELWMFVPCDEDGNILEEPDCNLDIRMDELQKYQQAKERCLFEGFEYNSETEQLNKGRLFLFFSPKFCEIYLNGDTEYLELIEEITKYNLQLTQTAIKQLGL